MIIRRTAIIVGLCAALGSFSGGCSLPRTKAAAPSQPASGHGGMDYAHNQVSKSPHGSGATGYWLFTPAEPTPQSAAVIVMLHGWAEINPQPYGAWIEHLVRRGHVVIFPRYQKDVLTAPDQFTDYAAQAVRHALATLQQDGHVAVDLERFVIVGHSVGGMIAANLAARHARDRLPAPKALMCVHPGPRALFAMDSLSKVPAQTLVLSVAGDRDRITAQVSAQMIYTDTRQVPRSRKAFVLVLSDDHGKPPLRADHAAPLAMHKGYDSGVIKAIENDRKPPKLTFHLPWHTEPNALDYFGYWRLLDALCEAAFSDAPIEQVVGNKTQRSMGAWSDGVPVKALQIVDVPAD